MLSSFFASIHETKNLDLDFLAIYNLFVVTFTYDIPLRYHCLITTYHDIYHKRIQYIEALIIVANFLFF